MSRTIGNMILKAAPVGTDMVAIADSEDSDKTKKVLLSALSGGGDAKYYHELKNVTMTFNVGNNQMSRITADCDGLTTYEEGIYVLKATATNSSGESGYGVSLNINNLGYKQCRLLSDYIKVQNAPLPSWYFQNGYIYIFLYEGGIFYNIYCPYYSFKQSVDYRTSSSVTVDLHGYDPYGHPTFNSVVFCSDPLTSLTVTNSPIQNQGFEQEIQFTTDSTFTFTAAGLVGKWIGGTPTFEPNKSYVIAIKNGLAAWGEVS